MDRRGHLLGVLAEVEQRLKEDEALIRRQCYLIEYRYGRFEDTRDAARLLRGLEYGRQLHRLQRKALLAELGD
jgi:hypothetical protein